MNTTAINSVPNRPLRLLVETGDGRTSSAILENGFLRHCLSLGAEVHVISPGGRFEPFVERYRLPGTQFTYLSVEKAWNVGNTRLVAMETSLAKWFCKHGFGGMRRVLWKLLGERLLALDGAYLSDFIDGVRPDCFLSANINLGFGRGLVAQCRRKGIPTIGNIYSWDHPYYEQRSRPDRLTCWSPIVRDGLVRMGCFLPQQIDIIGAPVFDPYFDPDGIWTREKFCGRMGLDPTRPIILFATLGQLRAFWDETGTFRAFIEALDQAKLPKPPQIILRLHPLSVDHYFEEFRSRSDIVFSRYVGYCPGIRHWPSRDEVILAGNLLRHADVCISPGSSMTVEAAIFDTPSIVPTFNPSMPEEYDRFFRENWLNKHFHFLVQEDTVGLAKSPGDLMALILRALNDRTWLAAGRRKIRDRLLGPLDGHATERLAKLTVKSASQYATAKLKV